ncbi:MAG: hypothetical protein ACTSRW_00265 [Candidatus Helarchaeota archaeon]
MSFTKLSKSKRLLGKIGRWFYFRSSKKFKLYTLNLLYRALLRYLAEMEGDLQTAIKVLNARMVSPEASNILYELMTKKVGGYSFESFVTQDLSDLEYVTPFFLYVVFGSYSKEMFGKITARPDENGVYILRVPIKKCFMCMFEKERVSQELGDEQFGSAFSVIMNTLIQNVMDFAFEESPYEIITEETKCLCKGDPVGEVTSWFHKKSE